MTDRVDRVDRALRLLDQLGSPYSGIASVCRQVRGLPDEFRADERLKPLLEEIQCLFTVSVRSAIIRAGIDGRRIDL